jgi:hypothetical protein
MKVNSEKIFIQYYKEHMDWIHPLMLLDNM